MPVPKLLLTPDESRDRSGPVTPALTGPDRVRDGAWWLEEGTTNLFTNPTHIGTASPWVRSANAPSIPTIDTVNTHEGRNSVRSESNVFSVHGTMETQWNAVIMPISSGEIATYSAVLRGSGMSYQPITIVRQGASDSWSAVLEAEGSMLVLDSSWQQIVVTSDPAPYGAVHVMLRGVPLSTNNGAMATLLVASPQVEVKGHKTSFASGDMGPGYSWAGAPYASASVRAPGTLSAPLTGPLGSVLIRYRENGVVHHAQLAASGTFGTYGTVSISGGTIELGTTREVDVLGVVAHEEALPPDQLQRLEDMPYWSWGGVVPQIGGVRIRISGDDLAALVSAGKITWNV